MFTGLVEETGVVRQLRKRKGGMELRISGKKTVRGLRVDDSISVQGVCLTVVRRTRSGFAVQVVEETLSKTTLGRLVVGDRVNLERSLLPSDRLGGHFVLGHVDTVGTVVESTKLGSSSLVWIRVPARSARWLIPVGSVAVDGISLTVARLRTNEFAVAIIPHTTDLTTSGLWTKGRKVNVEFDMIGKYVDRLLGRRRR